MPLLRKVIDHGDSRGITLPATWLEYIERQSGRKLKEVTLEVNRSITITPVIENAKEAPQP